MVRARFIGQNHYHEGERIEQGDIIDLTEGQYDRWSYQFELLESEDSEEDSEAEIAEESESEAESESSEDSGDSPLEEEESPQSDSEESERKAEISDEYIKETLQRTVPEVEDALESGEFDDALDRVESTEYAGENRRGVMEAIEDRREG